MVGLAAWRICGLLMKFSFMFNPGGVCGETWRLDIEVIRCDCGYVVPYNGL